MAVFAGACTNAQQNGQKNESSNYEWPTDPLVKAKLDKWQDQKFGMLIHWGLYAIPGIVESWKLCSEDESWIGRDTAIAYDDFKKWYWGLNKDFNPVSFNPEQWAKAGKDAGMKYLVFTTKHHDGFCLFDTKQTDFKISAGPFKDDPRADVAKYIFDAFRKNDFMIGAYYSKPDWHSEYYWWPRFATPDRNNNYDIKKHPWRWDQFKQFTYNQVSELANNYGSIDILWLDGGWVRPPGQDIDVPGIAAMARKAQPGLLVVDRTVHGKYENYQTPEQNVPAQQLAYPWESCITLGVAWGYIPHEQFKSPAKVIHLLIEIVAKGGSLLLGVGPRPDGTLSPEVISRLEEIGKWMKLNGNAIYNTRSTKQYQDGAVYFTKDKTGPVRYALVTLPENKSLPATVEWGKNIPKAGSAITLLQTGEKVKWINENGRVKVTLPSSLLESKQTLPALAFSFISD